MTEAEAGDKKLLKSLSDNIRKYFLDSQSENETEEVNFVKKLFDITRLGGQYFKTNPIYVKVVYICLFPLLASSIPVTRLESYRLARLLFTSPVEWKIMMELRYDIHFIRVIFHPNEDYRDVNQVICMLGKAIRICRELIPMSIIKCLSISCSDFSESKNKFKRTMLGILVHLLTLTPTLLFHINIHAPLIQIGFVKKQPPYLVEIMLSILMSIYENPCLRTPIFEDTLVESLFGPFTDLYYVGRDDSPDDSSNQNAGGFCRTVSHSILVLLRSWPGLVLLSKNDKGIKSLIDVLPNAPTQVQMIILKLFSDAFYVTNSINGTTFSEIISNLKPYGLFDQMALLDGLEALNEISTLIRHQNHRAVDIKELHQGFLVKICVNYNIIDSLTRTIFRTKDTLVKSLSVIVLGEILCKYNQLIPIQARNTDFLENLFTQYLDDFVDSPQYLDVKNIVFSLDEYYRWKREYLPTSNLSYISSLILGNNDNEGISIKTANVSSNTSVSDKSYTYVPVKVSDNLIKMISESHVCDNSSECWDWEMIKRIFDKYPLIAVEKSSQAETGCYKFMTTLKEYYLPQQNNFSSVRVSDTLASLHLNVGFQFFKCLLHPGQSNEGLQLVNEFLTDLSTMLKTFNDVDNTNEHKEKEIKRQNLLREWFKSLEFSMSKFYFLFIGLIQRYRIGRAFVDTSSVLNHLYELFEDNVTLNLAIAVIPCLNYTRSVSRRFVGCIVSSNCLPEVKFFCMHFMKIYFKITKDSSANWVLTYLIKLIFDLNETVCRVASEILDELIDSNLQAAGILIDMQLPFNSMGTNGVRIISRIISILPKNSYSLDPYIKDYPTYAHCWINDFIKQYTILFEDKLFREFTSYKNILHGNDLEIPKHSFILNIHLSPYKLSRIFDVNACKQMIHFPDDVSESASVIVKERLLFLANYGSSSTGLRSILHIKPNILEEVITMIYKHPFLSVRWIAFIVINSVSKCKIGREMLKRLHWFPDEVYQNPWVKRPELRIPQHGPDCIIVTETTASNVNRHKFFNRLYFNHHHSKLLDEPTSSTTSFETGSTRSAYSKHKPEKNEKAFTTKIEEDNTKLHHKYSGDDRMMVKAVAKSIDEVYSKDHHHIPTFISEVFENSNMPDDEKWSMKLAMFDEFLLNKGICIPLNVEPFFHVECNKDLLFHGLKPAHSIHSIESNLPVCKPIPYACMKCVMCGCRKDKKISNTSCVTFPNISAQSAPLVLDENNLDIFDCCFFQDNHSESNNEVLNMKIIGVFFHMFSPSLAESGFKTLDEIKEKYENKFSDNCLFIYLLDTCLSYAMNARVYQYIFYYFDTIRWDDYLIVGKSVIDQYLSTNEDTFLLSSTK